MKLSLALGPRQPLSRQMAWGCFTTNLALPGFGSLLGRRAVGYAQIPFTVVGFGLSLIGTITTFLWLSGNWSRMQQTDDTGKYFSEMWSHIRWPILGIGLFAFALLWALMTSLSIMSQARAAEASRPLPPKL
jgi:hypothetical protein